MKIFTNKKIWQKIVIIVLIILAFQIFIPKAAHAIPGDVLLEPITNLFANLGDGIMGIMQKTFMNMDTSGAWVETSSNLWLKILIIAAAIVVATLAVAATILSGGAALTIILGATAAVVKIGIGAAVAYYAVETLHFGEEGFYLPEFALTPQAIFQNEILAFDVNFFNPKENKVTVIESEEVEEEFKPKGNYTVIYDGWIVNLNKNDKLEDLNNWTGNSKNDARTAVEKHEGYHYLSNTDTDKLYTLDDAKKYAEKTCNDTFSMEEDKVFTDNMSRSSVQLMENTYTTDSSGHYKVRQTARITSEKRVGYIQIIETFSNGWIRDSDGNIVKKYYNEKKEKESESKTELSSARILQPTVAAWYKAFRNIALVALLSILVYVGIRIILSSTASDKAKHKQMLVDWVVALCLVFLMHYIMAFAVTLNEKIIDVVSSIKTNNLGSVDNFVTDAKDKPITTKASKKTRKIRNKNGGNSFEKNKFDDVGAEFFIINNETDVKNAYNTLIGDKDDEKGENDTTLDSGTKSSYNSRFSEDKKTLYWPVSDFMAQARLLGQNHDYRYR